MNTGNFGNHDFARERAGNKANLVLVVANSVPIYAQAANRQREALPNVNFNVRFYLLFCHVFTPFIIISLHFTIFSRGVGI